MIMESISFVIDGVGAFELRPALSHLEEIKLKMAIDEFMDYTVDTKRDKAFGCQEAAIEKLLKKHFDGRQKEQLSKEELSKLNDLYSKDFSREALVSKEIFWDLYVIENAFRLNMLKISTPDGMDFLKMDHDKQGLFVEILTRFNALNPLSQKKKN